MDFDGSVRLDDTENNPYSSTRFSQMFKMNESNISHSMILNDTSILRALNDTTLRQADETTLHGGKRIHVAGAGLDEIYFEIIQNAKASIVDDTLSRLVQACNDSLELVESWNRFKSDNYWLAAEANTWRLLYCLYTDSLQKREESADVFDISKPVLSQTKLLAGLFESDAELRLLQLLVDWLEGCAAYQDAALPAVGRIGSSVQWENTLQYLVNGVALFNRDGERKDVNSKMVSCMDPDAPQRQKKTIHSLDQQDDDNLCKRIFKEIRCGRFDEATSLCLNAGQMWRGAVLQGWRLLHYPDMDENATKLSIVGNPSRDLWKWCCMGILTNVQENIYYRGTVGVLCGHLQSTLLVCENSWEDLLWAHLRIQIESRVDTFLREHFATVNANTTPMEVLDLLQKECQTIELSLHQVFGAVNALCSDNPENSYQTTQRFLMLGHVASILQESKEWLETSDQNFIRFLAHLILILRFMGKDPQHDLGDNILQAYVCQLISKVDGTLENPEMIAHYCAALPKSIHVELYANLMERVQKKYDRKRIHEAGVKAGLDVEAAARATVKRAISSITKKHVSNIKETFRPKSAIDNETYLVNYVTGTLEWISFNKDQYIDAVYLSNAMIRMYILIRDINAANITLATFQRLWPNILHELSSTSVVLREYLCLKVYIEAVESFASWYRNFLSGEPKGIGPLPTEASFTDKVQHEQRRTQATQQQARWMAATMQQGATTKECFYSILSFPGGWLLDEFTENNDLSDISPEELLDRAKQLEALRRSCIPEAVLLLLKLLQSGNEKENHVEAVKLADLVASECRTLYKVFTKDNLKEVLLKIRESCLFLLESKTDSFGYEIDGE